MTQARPALAYLRSVEWTHPQHRYQCPACSGHTSMPLFRPEKYRSDSSQQWVNYWLAEQRRNAIEPKGHKADCRLALAIEDAGGDVAWVADFIGPKWVSPYAGMTTREALDAIMYKHIFAASS